MSLQHMQEARYTRNGLLLLNSIALFASPVAAQHPTLSVDDAAAAIQAAYSTANVTALAEWFADTVTFDGEVRVLVRVADGKEALRDSTIVLRPEEVVRPFWIAATLSGPVMAEVYRELINEIGQDRFRRIVASRPWRLIKADRLGFPYSAVREGDHVAVLHLRRDSEPDNLDEAVIFVLREVAGQYRIVAHFADY